VRDRECTERAHRRGDWLRMDNVEGESDPRPIERSAGRTAAGAAVGLTYSRWRRMKITTLRTWHAMISAFIAPMVLFFSLSGALQIFDFHESHGAYMASSFLQSVGRLHKQQVFAPVPARERPAGAATAPRRQAPPPEPAMRRLTLLLKILFFWEAVALAVTTLFGVWIAVTHPKYARRSWLLIGAGTLVPLLLLIL